MTDINAEYENLFTEFPELGPKFKLLKLYRGYGSLWCWREQDGTWNGDEIEAPAISIIRDSLRQWIEGKGYSFKSFPPLWDVSGMHQCEAEHLTDTEEKFAVHAVLLNPPPIPFGVDGRAGLLGGGYRSPISSIVALTSDSFRAFRQSGWARNRTSQRLTRPTVSIRWTTSLFFVASRPSALASVRLFSRVRRLGRHAPHLRDSIRLTSNHPTTGQVAPGCIANAAWSFLVWH